MAFGVYVHIPYCIQRCTYCDFATYEQTKILPPEKYVELVKMELSQRHQFFPKQKLDTLYFGGGTPSLIEPNLIISMIQELEKFGFERSQDCEVTIEINPATINDAKLDFYLENGINRFSVGAQTFKDSLLKSVHREHNAHQTLETLALLKKREVNFSFDVLFALPGQSLDDLKRDLDIGLALGASHISPYCLTVPETHPLSKGRPPEEEQVQMFDLICERLTEADFLRYEISNFAKAGKESRHNLLYWTDQDYFSLGLSSHSYRSKPDWGLRFWNQSNINDYEAQIRSFANHATTGTLDFERLPELQLPSEQFELLEKHQSLTDFCHTSLRLMSGLSMIAVIEKFGAIAAARVEQIAIESKSRGLLQNTDEGRWALTEKGIVISNQVFEKFTFLSRDL